MKFEAVHPLHERGRAALRRLGASHRTDVERVPLARARGRVLAETIHVASVRLAAGQRLTPENLATLAQLGHAEVHCARRPTVALFTSGDALRSLGQALAGGERFDACRSLLLALLAEAGLEPVAWPILPGDPARVRSALEDAAQAFDVVMICGETDAKGLPKPAVLFDTADAATLASLPLALTATDASAETQASPWAVAGPFGSRAPRALMLALPEDHEALARTWSQFGGLLIDAMQGLHDLSTDPIEINVRDIDGWRAIGARLIDVREPGEQAAGLPLDAESIPWSRFEREPRTLLASNTPILLLCASGQRSLRAAMMLRDHGLTEVYSLRGGLQAWRAAGLSISAVSAVDGNDGLGADALDRYDRHLRLAAVGPAGQKRLLASRVVVIGAGGLGSPAAFYLAAAGVGSLVLIDDDRVERSNLQRQILHVDAAIGCSKVESAHARLSALNPTIEIEAIHARVDPGNIESLLRGADVVIDASDNFATRHLVNAGCLRLQLPLVYGAVERFIGQVAVFDARHQHGRSPCYSCLFPESPGAGVAANCVEAGVLGVLPGLIGLLQATETLKLLLGLGQPLIGRLLTVDALAMRFRTLELPVDPDCPVCGNRR